LVSVVIPVRNRAGLVEASIRSVLAQTYSHFELVVVDDASEDATAEAIRAVTDPRVRLVRRSLRGGPSVARNDGLAAARGEWVAFQDSDDLWLPEKLEKQVSALYASPVPPVAVYTSYRRDDGRSLDVLPRLRPGLDGDVTPALLRGNFITPQTLMVRRDLALQIGGFDPAMPPLEDWEFALRLSRLGPFRHVAEPLVEYRLQADSLSTKVDLFQASYKKVMAKHWAEMCPTPAQEAWHWAVLGSRLCREGRTRQGRFYLGRAWKRMPGDIRYAGAWVLSWLPSSLFRCITESVGRQASKHMKKE
jgi:glycosyltransferase involved in cell wall biosynthesis